MATITQAKGIDEFGGTRYLESYAERNIQKIPNLLCSLAHKEANKVGAEPFLTEVLVKNAHKTAKRPETPPPLASTTAAATAAAAAYTNYGQGAGTGQRGARGGFRGRGAIPSGPKRGRWSRGKY